ncbi:MAG TPA: hypothetical protein PK299_02350 [Anaerolineales bacterium]|nr:hypothetical protein [Anaerolineales bacterium]
MAEPTLFSQTGWQSAHPIPNQTYLTDYLQVREGDLWMMDLNLHHLTRDLYGSPLEIVCLPLIRQQVANLRKVFAQAIEKLGYSGKFEYAYASKANAAEEVVRTVLGVHTNYELSSAIDVDIAAQMKARSFLSEDTWVLCNGFKPPHSPYANAILKFREKHARILPILAMPSEIDAFAGTGWHFDVGLRQKAYGSQRSLTNPDASNSRFGLHVAGIWEAAKRIAQSGNLRLTMLHAMVGGQVSDIDTFIQRISPSIHLFAQLRQTYPELHILNFGGGMPVAMTLDFKFDYALFAERLLSACRTICQQYQVPPPDIWGEMGRYTVASHGAHLFKVISVHENQSELPWYIINGSIMSSFPDSWALNELFIVLPLNHLDKPFQRVQLGGITCDSDDIYPKSESGVSLYLPAVNDDLYVGFFCIGAYQEMLGGSGGAKHCVIPEANELIVDISAGEYTFNVVRGQDAHHIMRNLGYL